VEYSIEGTQNGLWIYVAAKRLRLRAEPSFKWRQILLQHHNQSVGPKIEKARPIKTVVQLRRRKRMRAGSRTRHHPGAFKRERRPLRHRGGRVGAVDE
jgi:hypothetical protein